MINRIDGMGGTEGHGGACEDDWSSICGTEFFVKMLVPTPIWRPSMNPTIWLPTTCKRLSILHFPRKMMDSRTISP
jgi:hypothetical protein